MSLSRVEKFQFCCDAEPSSNVVVVESRRTATNIKQLCDRRTCTWSKMEGEIPVVQEFPMEEVV